MMECGGGGGVVLPEGDGFEPQQRARSNTWPLPRPENFLEVKEEPGTQCQDAGGMAACLPDTLQGAAPGTKKNSSRRNAWGNLSYADLITQAITTAPEKRLTLSQIYEYMVHNVPYFKDKGDSNSSAGWKNSIRHNLSLHNRFMRVQNEGTGKSSWWMINPDAKPGKSARRRATSMETSKFEKRRGRVKKKVEALRNGLTLDHTPSPSSSVSEGLDLFPDSPLHAAAGFQLSPDFRPRASSNASSCGRLSPIPSVLGDSDWTSPPPSFPAPPYGPADQLAGNLADGMKLHQQGPPPDQFCMGYVQPPPPPPPYSAAPGGGGGYEPTFARLPHEMAAPAPQFGGGSGGRCPLHRLQPCPCLSPSSYHPAASEPPHDHPHYARRLPPRTPSTMMGQLMGALNNSTLLDDLNLNIETLHGGFDCNVDEVIKHELSMDGSLDFNFTGAGGQGGQGMGGQEGQQGGAAMPGPPYSTSVATGHWVH